MSRTYSKPHHSLDDQIELLRKRNLEISDVTQCKEALLRLGYYRISAYLYSFRELKPPGKKNTKWNFRYDHFKPGHSFEEAIALYNFDLELRSLVFEALTYFEISLKTAVALHAGKHDKFIHLRRQLLDEKACSFTPRNSSEDSYTIWKRNYSKQLKDAKSEDFIKHHMARYSEEVPIWIATEFLSFGSIVFLFSYLPDSLKSQIASSFGTTDGKTLVSWARNFNHVRNVAAHHSRLWNRMIVAKVQKPHPSVVEPSLSHLTDESHKGSNTKIYPTLALIAYTLSFLDPENDWRLRLADLIKRFPNIDGLSPSIDMGFPEHWLNLAIWRNDVSFVNGSE